MREILNDELNSREIIGFLDYLKHPEIEVLQSVNSTSTYAKNHLRFDRDQIIISEEQTKGYGRGLNSFYSPRARGIYMTLVFPHQIYRINRSKITLSCAVATLAAIEQITGMKLKLKWVNDLVLNSKKYCGTLIETIKKSSQEYLLIGIGLDTEELKDDFSAVESNWSRNRLIAQIYFEIQKIFVNGNKYPSLNKRLFSLLWIGEIVTIEYINLGKLSGTLMGFNQQTALVIVDGEGKKWVFDSKYVRHLRKVSN